METHSRYPFSTTAPLSIKNLENSSELLQGWSLAVKDVIDVAKLPTGAGNPTWEKTHSVPKQHAKIVQKLLNAGAEITCKTITDELAYSLNGMNVHYPGTTNCLDVNRMCGGSTSGSAVAVGEGVVRIGLGTDTGGSIRVPSSYNNLVGFRPSHGTISGIGVVPLAPSFDTLGWITTTVDDALTVGKVLLENNDVDSPVLKNPVLFNSLISLCEYENELNQWANENLDHNVEHCEKLNPSIMHSAANTFRILQGLEIWQQHGQWITTHSPVFAPDINSRLTWCQTLSREDKNNALKHQQAFNSIFTQYLKNDQFIVMPTTPGPAPLISADKDTLAEYRNKLMMFTCAAGLSGCPQLHLPVFTGNKTAYGISLIGPKHSDLRLLELGKRLMENTIGKFNESNFAPS